MRTTLTLDDDIYDTVSEISRATGERLGVVVSTLIKKGMEPSSPPGASTEDDGFDLETFQPNSMGKINLAEIRRSIEEEGLEDYQPGGIYHQASTHS